MLSLEGVLVSLLAGALVGLEREHTKRQHRVGLRTFSLMSLLGYATSAFQETSLLAIGFATSCAFALLLYLSRDRRPRIGFTTSISVILVFVIGVMIGRGIVREAIYLSVLVTVILYMGRKVHRFVEKITEEEWQDFIELVVLLGLVYPLMPGEVFFQGITVNLRIMWVLVIMLVGLNFALFAGARLVSARKELPVVVLLSDSSQSPGLLSTVYKQDRKSLPLLRAAFHLLLVGPFIRNFALAVAMVPSLLPRALVLMSVSFVVFYAAYRASLKGVGNKARLHIRSPFNVLEALKTGAVIFLVLWLLSMMDHSTTGVLAAAALGGLANGAATTISVLSSGVTGSQAFLAVTIASTTSTITAVALLYLLGAKEVVRQNLKYLPELLVPLVVAVAIA